MWDIIEGKITGKIKMLKNGNRNLSPPKRIELKVSAEEEFLNVVRLSLAGVGERVGLSVDDIEDIKIASSEAYINVIHHAYPKDAEKKLIYITFLIYARKLEITIRDNGTGFDTFQVEEYLRKPDNEKIEGIGLGVYLIKTLMDEVEYYSSNEGTEVKMVKYK